ncbi:hypothetical protein RJT34_11293 [Clitoria ternatea]|uniref:Uncharacterized protein n=1 Tax=Clitoria ternatea TaxID=43366 RepID=A0AAN9JLN7_CLITE
MHYLDSIAYALAIGTWHMTLRAVDVVFVIEHIFDRDLTDFDEIGQEELVNGFGGIGHEDAASEGGFFEEVGQRSDVVKVKVSDEEDVDGGRDDFIEVG